MIKMVKIMDTIRKDCSHKALLRTTTSTYKRKKNGYAYAKYYLEHHILIKLPGMGGD